MATAGNDLERRSFATELRAESSGSVRKLVGYAALFNSLSEEMYGFRERIAPGAFRGSLDGDIRAFWNHDTGIVLGRTKAGTLEVSEDERGLRVVIYPPDTGTVRDLLESIKRGDVDQMSFGFRVEPKGETWTDENGQTIRTLTRVRLVEVSPVAIPAYSETTIAARSRPGAVSGDGSIHAGRLRLLDLQARAAGINL